MDKVAIFIDAANLSYASKLLNTTINFNLLLPHMMERFRWSVINAFYYTALINHDSGFIERQNQMDWLRTHGFTVKTKPAKQFRRDDGTVRTKGNMDIEMAVGMVRASESGRLDRLVMLSGDGDFTALVEYIQETKGVPVTVVSPEAMTARELRSMCNQYIDLKELVSFIEVKRNVEVSIVKRLRRA